MMVAEMVYCIRQPYAIILYTTGKFKETTSIAILEAGVNLSFSTVLCYFMGIYGVIIGTLAANLIRMLYDILLSAKHILKESIYPHMKRYLWMIGMFAIVLVVQMTIKSYLSIATWGSLAATDSLFVIVFGIIALIKSFFL